MAELTGNKAIEDVAIKWIGELERAPGRLAEATRYAGSAGDVESPPRVIEVKAAGRTCRGNDLWLETHQVKARLRAQAGGPTPRPARGQVTPGQRGGASAPRSVRSDPGANGLAAVITARDGVRHSLALDASGLISGGCPRVSWNLRCGPISSRYTVK